MDDLDLGIKRVNSLQAIAIGLTRLKWLSDAERLTLAMNRHDRALKGTTQRSRGMKWGNGQMRVQVNESVLRPRTCPDLVRSRNLPSQSRQLGRP